MCCDWLIDLCAFTRLNVSEAGTYINSNCASCCTKLFQTRKLKVKVVEIIKCLRVSTNTCGLNGDQMMATDTSLLEYELEHASLNCKSRTFSVHESALSPVQLRHFES